jgi:small subunit ribosomal protein S1
VSVDTYSPTLYHTTYATMPSTTRTRPQSVLIQAIKDDAQLFAPLKVGDLVEGTVTHKGSRLILVDLGKHGTGAVYGSEISSAREIVRELDIGSTLTGKVADLDNEDGYVELAIAETGAQKSWDEVTALYGKEEVFTVTPSGYNKGGLIADVAGLKAFLPLSQLAGEHYPKVPDGDKEKIIEELQRLQEEEFSVKIIDINQKQNKVIISEKAAVQESAKELALQYSVGQEVEGVISGVADFGAFVKFTDNPSIEGLIHVSELSHKAVENAKEIVKVDDVITAKIIEIKEGKIYLSLKAMEEDPWAEAGTQFAVGTEVRGKVYQLTPVGAVISLGSLQGHVPITVFGSMEKMRSQLEAGKEYVFVVSEVKPEEQRIFLTLKKTGS